MHRKPLLEQQNIPTSQIASNILEEIIRTPGYLDHRFSAATSLHKQTLGWAFQFVYAVILNPGVNELQQNIHIKNTIANSEQAEAVWC